MDFVYHMYGSFDGLMFHGWQLERDFCYFIVKVCLYASCGMYPDEGKFDDIHSHC